jgi:hypothetical protein
MLDIQIAVNTAPIHILNGATGDTGGWISAGTGNNIQMCAGTAIIAGAWIAKGTSAAYLNIGSAGLNVNYASGLTVGNPITWTTPFTINAAGNVGIGQTSPLYKLDISGGSVATSQVHLSYDGSDTGGWLSVGSASNWLSLSGGTAFVNGSSIAKAAGAATLSIGPGGFAFYTDTALTIGSAFSPTQRMTITNAGNVGIGTTTPTSLLTIFGVGPQILIGDGTGNNYSIGRDSTAGLCYFKGTQATFSGYAFFVNGTSQVLTITNAGNVGIGTTTPAATLDVVGTVRFGAIPTTAPAAGSKQIWADPADSYRLKLAN